VKDLGGKDAPAVSGGVKPNDNGGPCTDPIIRDYPPMPVVPLTEPPLSDPPAI
jgi:hypothetical protein